MKERLGGVLITLHAYETYIPACGSFKPYNKIISKIQDVLNLEVKKDHN